jgi:non-ribosomal peptide synthetase component F
MQAGMLYHHLRAPGGGLHFEQLVLDITGGIDREEFERAWGKVVRSNEMLRAVFRWERLKEPVQMILKQHRPDIRYHRPPDRADRARWIEGIKNRDRAEGFDLAHVPFRINLCETGPRAWTMIISHHHILYDGWSSGIILNEFFRFYSAGGFQPGAKTSFKEYLRRLNGHWPSRGASTGREGAVSRGNYSAAPPVRLKNRMEEFAKSRRVTVASLCCTGWALLLQKYQDTGDAVFHTTVSGRDINPGGIENTVGMFIDTRAVRLTARRGERLEQLVLRLNRDLQTKEGYTGDFLPGFRTLAVLENYPLDRFLLDPGQTGPLTVTGFSSHAVSSYDIMLLITLWDGIEFRFTYNENLLDRQTIEGLARHFQEILEAVIERPGSEWVDIFIDAPVIEMDQGGEPEPAREYIAPRSDVEKRLANLWARVLSLPDPGAIGIDDDFFQCGGHSLNASLLAASLHKEFQVKLPLPEIFRSPTIRQLAAYIDKKKNADEGGECFQSIEPVEEKEYYPCSSAQKRFYMLQQLDPGSTVYNGVGAVTIDGPLDEEKAAASFKALVQRHESLRTSFRTVDAQPVQRIHEDVEWEMQYAAVSEEEKREAIEDFIRPFDLSNAPLVRAALLKLAGRRHLLLVDMHHIVTDGISETIVIKEFAAFYSGDEPGPVRVTYKDFCQWQRDNLASGGLDQSEAYWLRHFSRPLPLLRMPTDFPRPPVLSFAGDMVERLLEKPLVEQLRHLMRGAGATLFMVLLAVYNVLLNKYSGQQDIIVGTAVSGRDHADLRDTVGLLIETLAIRNYPSGDKLFSDFLKEVKVSTLGSFQHQGYPFRELTRKLGLETGAARNPLFDAFLVVQNYEQTALDITGLTITPYPLERNVARLDLYLEAWEKGDEILIELTYGTSLFQRRTMERFLDHFVTILETVVENPVIPVADIEMLTGEELAQIDAVADNETLTADFDF